MLRDARSLVVLAMALYVRSPLGQIAPCNDDLSDVLVKWATTCSERGCLLQTDVLRGDSGDPPDSKDFREFVGIDVALERTTQKPIYFAFHVHPNAQRDQGIFISFTKTVRDGKSWKVNLDSEGGSRLIVSDCDDKSCVATVAMGLVEKGKDRRNVNLLDKFLNADHLLLLYMKDGKPYRTMVLLSSFKKEYQRVLTTEFRIAGEKK